MTPTPIWRRYLRFWGPNVSADIDDELEFHVEQLAARYRRDGLTSSAARQRALEEFGDVAAAKRACREIGERQVRRHAWAEWVSEVVRDVQLAFRMLRKNPGFTAVVVLTLAMGIGATTSIFSVINAVLLRPLPYGQPESLIRLWETTPTGNQRNVVSPGNYVDWRARAKSFETIGAISGAGGIALTDEGEPTQVNGVDITASVLATLRTGPAIGRAFAEDDAINNPRVVLLSHEFWQRQFGGDPAILTRKVNLNDVSYTVLGVMPAGFHIAGTTADIWGLVSETQLDPNQRRSHNWLVIGRLADGVSLGQARTEMTGIAAALASEYPEFMTGFGVNVQSLYGEMVRGVRPVLITLLVGVIVVLLVACANIANLLLARAVTREREMAIRAGLGAGRGRLARQLLTESLVLAGLGAVLGFTVAALSLEGLVAIAPTDIPRLTDVSIDPTVLLFVVGTTFACAILFGLAPALHLARPNLQGTLGQVREPTGGLKHAQLRNGLLVAEVALSLVLLTGGGLLLRSFQKLQAVDYGYTHTDLLTIGLDLPRPRYPDNESQAGFYANLLERVRAIPGVRSAATTSEPPAMGFGMTFSFAIEGRPSTDPSGREDPQALRAISVGYFETMGIPLIRGRVFEAQDRADGLPVVIINQAMADRLWPNLDPVGTRISFQGQEGPWFEVIGVVGSTRIAAADEPPAPALYMSFSQKPWTWLGWQTLLTRIGPGQDPFRLVPAIQAALWDLDDRIPVQRVATVEQLYGERSAQRRFAAQLVGVFAVLALILGTVGIYGVLSYTVSRRRQEIGIRMALGAGRSEVMKTILRQGMLLTVIGVVIGGVAAFFTTRIMASLLYEVSPTDPVTFASVTLLLGGAALLAAWLPARRATRVDPVVVMRET